MSIPTPRIRCNFCGEPSGHAPDCKRPPDPFISPKRKTIDDLPFPVILLGILVLSASITGFGAWFVNRSAADNQREREERREQCLARGGSVQESEYGRYLGCIYPPPPTR